MKTIILFLLATLLTLSDAQAFPMHYVSYETNECGEVSTNWYPISAAYLNELALKKGPVMYREGGYAERPDLSDLLSNPYVRVCLLVMLEILFVLLIIRHLRRGRQEKYFYRQS